MLNLEGTIEGQADCIAELEDKVAILRLRKECKCGGVAGSALGSGSAKDPINLEYTNDEDSSLGGSYHTPPRVKEELLQIIGSPISQHLPKDVQTTCVRTGSPPNPNSGCPEIQPNTTNSGGPNNWYTMV